MGPVSVLIGSAAPKVWDRGSHRLNLWPRGRDSSRATHSDAPTAWNAVNSMASNMRVRSLIGTAVNLPLTQNWA
jgi:hypothetical protein